MEMILNENDIVVGARFKDGTIQDYIDDAQTYGLVRLGDSTANWFLFNKDDSPYELKALYSKVTKDANHYIQDDFGEEIVIFNKEGETTYEQFSAIIDEYLNAEMGNIF